MDLFLKHNDGILLVNDRPQQHKSPERKSIVPWVLVGIILILTALTSPPALDYIALTTADPKMVKLAENAGMNAEGKRLFIGAHPQLLADISDCSRGYSDETLISDGCFDESAHRIFIRDMPEELDGFETSTAAHEMLHAAYIILSDEERAHIDGLLKKQLDKLNDEELKERLASYDHDMPGSKNDELHSILPTEYIELSPELKNYYQRYFSDRSLAVKQDKLADTKFTSLEMEIETLERRLKSGERELYRADMLQAIATYNGDSGRIDQYTALVRKAKKEYEATEKKLNTKKQKYDLLNQNYSGYETQ